MGWKQPSLVLVATAGHQQGTFPPNAACNRGRDDTGASSQPIGQLKNREILHRLRCCQQRGAEIRAVLVLHPEMQEEEDSGVGLPSRLRLPTLRETSADRGSVLRFADVLSLLREGLEVLHVL